MSEELQDKLRLLIIDDDESMLQLMRNIARHHRQLTVEIDEDPKKALARIQNNEPYHIILTDINMPDINGVDILNAAKARSPDTKTIMVSGFAEHETLISAIKIGLWDYVHKPFRPEELNLTLNIVIENWRNVIYQDKLEQDLQRLRVLVEQQTQQIATLKNEKEQLQHELNNRPAEKSTNDLAAALAKAAQAKAGKNYSYSVFKALTDLSELLESKQITHDEFQSYRKTLLDKAYRPPDPA